MTSTRIPAPSRIVGLVVAGGALLAASACGSTAAVTPGTAPAPQVAPAAQVVAAPAAPAAGSPVTRAPVDAPKPMAAKGGGGAGSASPGDPMADAADGLRPFLLTATEIGPGFTVGDEPKPDPAVPAICGGPGTVSQFPYAVRVGTAFERAKPQQLVQEAVSVYGDAATAEQAYRFGVAGMDCSEGSISGKPVVLTPAEDLRGDVGGQEATGWRVGGEGFDVVMISVRSDTLVMTFTYLAAEGQSDRLPDPLATTRAGVQKLAG